MNETNDNDQPTEETKTITVEIGGEEHRKLLGYLKIQVPKSMTDEQIEELPPSFFDKYVQQAEWQLEDSDGIYGSDSMEVCVVGRKLDQTPAARLVQEKDGLELHPVQGMVSA